MQHHSSGIVAPELNTNDDNCDKLGEVVVVIVVVVDELRQLPRYSLTGMAGYFQLGGHPTKLQVVEPNHVVLCGIYCRKSVSVPCWFDAFVVWHTISPTYTNSKYSLFPPGVLYFVA